MNFYIDTSIFVQNDNRHAAEWKKCLSRCHAAIKKANNVFNGISSSTVCNEVIRSMEGSDYLTGRWGTIIYIPYSFNSLQ